MSPLCLRIARSQKTLVGRAQWGTHPGHQRTISMDKLEKTTFSGLLRPCLGRGATGRARVWRVKSLAFLSIMHRLLQSFQRLRKPFHGA